MPCTKQRKRNALECHSRTEEEEEEKFWCEYYCGCIGETLSMFHVVAVLQNGILFYFITKVQVCVNLSFFTATSASLTIRKIGNIMKLKLVVLWLSLTLCSACILRRIGICLFNWKKTHSNFKWHGCKRQIDSFKFTAWLSWGMVCLLAFANPNSVVDWDDKWQCRWSS